MLPPGEKQVSNPFSTGGGGEKLQDLVGAYYLTALLLGLVPRGIESGRTSRVRFQRLYEQELMDDLICDVETTVGLRKIALQLKNDVSFGEKSKVFTEVITACWGTFVDPDFRPGEDRMGFGLGVQQTVVSRHYQQVLHWARLSESAASFLRRIDTPNLSSNEKRDFVALIRQKLDAANGSPVEDERLWGFLRSLVLLDFDLLHPGSRDRAHAVDCLNRLLPAGQSPGAADLFTCLRELAGEVAIAAGEFNLQSLTQKLQERGFAIAPGIDCRHDLEILDEIGAAALDDIRVDIGGVRLDRTARVEEPAGEGEDPSLLLLIGPPGVGKSGVWRDLVEIHRQQGPAFVISADRIEGNGWHGFASSRGISNNLERLLLALGSHPRPCLFIDGLDRIEDAGAQRVVNDLLRTAKRVLTTSTGIRRWHCVATAREDGQERLRWLDREVSEGMRTRRVPPLDEDERSYFASHHQRLRPLLNERRLEPVMSIPFFLDLFTDRRFATIDAADAPSTEAAVSDIWWDRVVGKDSTPSGRERQQALIEAARRAIEAPLRNFADRDIPASALTTLEADVVLRRVPGRNTCRFAHDLLEDWSLLRLLDQHLADLTTFLKGVHEPSRVARAVQLFGCSLLENEATSDVWATLLRQIEAEGLLAPRWRQAILTAPLLSSRLGELLDRTEAVLLADKGRWLLDLIRLVRTTEIDANPAFERFIREESSNPEEVLSIGAHFANPRWRVWYGLLRWLLGKIEALPAEVQDEALVLMEVWQERSPAGTPLRSEIGELATRLLEREEAEEQAAATIFDRATIEEDDVTDGLIPLADEVEDEDEEG